MTFFGWKVEISRSLRFHFFTYQGKWNHGTHKRLYILWWELTAIKI